MPACGGAAAVDVVVTRLDVGPGALRASAALLSQEERHRAGRFAFECDRRRFTVARARLRQLLAARLDIGADSVELVYGERGKPALARRVAASNLRFSVSHCDDVAVYAFAFGREVGIDVERTSGRSVDSGLIEAFCSGAAGGSTQKQVCVLTSPACRGIETTVPGSISPRTWPRSA